ncbi:ArsC/Spx/MgsR family protein [Ponticaulis sp.]|uniref:ArsC/Spx/MgsR family protein n=1 Tax=Ponticaulis sp. TaxID=2020902 RepID=UPI000B725409|nr:ArsC/Spx/MgsR family protein [Ponticaulis sp.]MAI89985.1 ArsC family transcriptional regulator [Ponticaulis sp.]OUX99648.1 MAG: ArsC family transcriptional regulator [Hyphomonadaceae bacterium TMED5]
MSLTLYGLKNCDTCKKALKALEAAGKEVRFVDIRAEADLSEKVPYWLSAVGAKPLVNNRSTTWRGLSDAEKAKAETDEVSALLISNATLIKRPVIEAGDKVYVGWTKAVEAELTA